MYPPNDEIGARVLRSLRELSRRLSSQFRNHATPQGLSGPSVQCLRVIEDADAHDMTVSRVAEATQLARSTVSTIADRLVREGLVARSRSKRDRRRVNLTLTERGKAQLEELPDPLESVFLERLAALPASQRQDILHTLELVVGMMQAGEYTPPPTISSGGHHSLHN